MLFLYTGKNENVNFGHKNLDHWNYSFVCNSETDTLKIICGQIFNEIF